jgi:UDP-2,3-diacylglucosamine pyrophosphatase LpxH
MTKAEAIMVPSFDDLYVVSDLHLGGKPGFQIFNQGNRLAAVIERLASLSQKEGKQIGLVLNGDIVDFLAEAGEDQVYLDPLHAVDKLRRIHVDPSFSMVWTALEKYVTCSNCRLILVLGNHDVELALPHVREWLLSTLSENDSAARGRITLAMDGSGFACTVGGKKVLCVHGNEVDEWNLVNYWALLGVSRAINRGEQPPEWDANAGTRLVIEAMNKIKRTFPVVDLLKPEVEAVFPVLAVLNPDRLEQFGKFLRVLPKLSWDRIRHSWGFLSAEKEAEKEQILLTEEEVLSQFINGKLLQPISTSQRTVTDLLWEAYHPVDKQESTGRLGIEDTEFLGFDDWIRKIKQKIKDGQEEMLRQTLQKLLYEDRSFDVQYRDSWFHLIDKEIGPQIDYVIAGHTHLERANERRYLDRYYFNSGTWIRLIQLDLDILGNPDEFHRIFLAFQQPLDQLDKLMDLGKTRNRTLIRHISTVVSIKSENRATYGELGHAQDDGTIVSVPNTRFPRR